MLQFPTHAFEFRGLQGRWKAVSYLVIVSFFAALARNTLPNISAPSLGSVLTLAGAGLMIFEFTVGQFGLTGTVEECNRAARSKEGKMHCRSYSLIDTVFLLFHGAALISIAWASTSNVLVYVYATCVLASVNVCWLVLRIRHFMWFLATMRAKNQKDRALRVRIIESCDAAVLWVVLNASFTAIANALFCAPKFEGKLELLLALILTRAVADFCFGYRYYNAVTHGDFSSQPKGEK